MTSNPAINPYNFVPLGTGPKRVRYLGQDRLANGLYSGALCCTLQTLTPFITLDQRSKKLYLFENGMRQPCKIPIFKFLTNGENTPIIQGATLKGMLRAVYEAATDSCLPLTATSGTVKKRGSFQYTSLGNHNISSCNSVNNLCPSCSLFGIATDAVSCTSRITCTEAAYFSGEVISSRIFLQELSNPKPDHYQTYSKDGLNRQIAGRKFYYHHHLSATLEKHNASSRCIGIDKLAMPKTLFRFRVMFKNVTQQELSRLIRCIELQPELAHKLGLGKSIGLGSCTIRIDRERSEIVRNEHRYTSYKKTTVDDWNFFQDTNPLPPALVELLRLNKWEDGKIAYPPYNNYPRTSIDKRGEFGGTATDYGTPPEVVSAPVKEPPRSVKPGQQPVWLKQIGYNELILVDTDNNEIVKPRRAFQGKKELLQTGHWFILSGTNAVFPVR